MLTIGAIARQAGIRASAVRYYETQGLLRPAWRLPNGYRIYGEDALALLHFVRRAQTLGITIRELKQLLELSRQGQRPCPQVKELARRHLHDLDLKVKELKHLRKQLQLLLHRQPSRNRSSVVCPLIEESSRRL
jgi:MerR family copper efflux transcriptional regulator